MTTYIFILKNVNELINLSGCIVKGLLGGAIPVSTFITGLLWQWRHHAAWMRLCPVFSKAALADSSLAIGSASLGVTSRSSAGNGWIVQASLAVCWRAEKEIGRRIRVVLVTWVAQRWAVLKWEPNSFPACSPACRTDEFIRDELEHMVMMMPGNLPGEAWPVSLGILLSLATTGGGEKRENSEGGLDYLLQYRP